MWGPGAALQVAPHLILGRYLGGCGHRPDRSPAVQRLLPHRCSCYLSGKARQRANGGERREPGRMTMRKWWSLVLASVLAAALTPGSGNAQYRGGTIRIGVLNDQSGLYADIAGTASVWMARKAVEDFGAAAKGMKVEIIGGDHQNKPDIGLSIARQWF